MNGRLERAIWRVAWAAWVALLATAIFAGIAQAEPPAGAEAVADAIEQRAADQAAQAVQLGQEGGAAVRALDCEEQQPCPPQAECPPAGYKLVPIADEPPAPEPVLPTPVGELLGSVAFTGTPWVAGPAKPQFEADPRFGWTAIQPAGRAAFEFVQDAGALVLRSWVPGAAGETNKAMSTVEGAWPIGSVVTLRAEYLLPNGPQGRVTVFDLEDSRETGQPGVRFQLEDGGVVWNRDKLRLSGKQRTFKAPARVPAGRWFAVTVEVTVGTGFDGRVRMWLDAEQILDVRSDTTRPGWTYDRVQFALTARTSEHGALELRTRSLEIWQEGR